MEWMEWVRDINLLSTSEKWKEIKKSTSEKWKEIKKKGEKKKIRQGNV